MARAMSRSASAQTRAGEAGQRPGGLSLSLLTSPDIRAQRVALVLLATCLLGVYDLALTLVFSTSIGMVELNPLARLIMRVYDSPFMLIAWKLLSMGLSAGIIWRIRRTRIGELAAWLALVVLLALCLHWAAFVRDVALFASEYHSDEMLTDSRFVVLGAE